MSPRFLPSLFRSSLLSILLLNSGVKAAPGDLDAAFGTGGAAISDFSVPDDPRFDRVTAMAVQDDGKIVVAGFSGNAMALARYSADGSPDTTFGTSGKLRFAALAGATSVAILNNGNIVVAGPSGLLRLLEDGSLDPTFGGDGSVETGFPEYQLGSAVAIRPDGRILVAGRREIYLYGSFNTQLYLYEGFAVACYLENGALDQSFGTGGRASVDLGRDARTTAIALDDQGRILLAGSRNEPSGYDLALVRLLTNGALDPSFNATGKLITSFGYDDKAPDLAVLPDGKILVGLLADRNAALARYLPNGSLDPEFDGDGKVTTTVELGDWVGPNRIGLAVAGGTIVLGGTSDDNTPPRLTVAKFLADGSFDATFNVTGVATYPLDEGGSTGTAAAIQDSGKILISGSSGNDFAVARYLVEGPGIQLSPPAGYLVEFGRILVGGPPGTRTFTLRNHGTEALGGFAITFGGPGAAAFSTVSTLPEALAPGASTTFQVRFAPLVEPPTTATLQVTSNDPTRSPTSISLKGSGYTRAGFSLEMPDGSPLEGSNDHLGGQIEFGASPAGVPVDLTLTIRNPGSAPLTGLAATTTGGDFTIVAPPVAPVPPGGSSTITVRFTPTAFGVRGSNLRIPNNVNSSFYIRMNGIGIAPAIVVEGPTGAPIVSGSGVHDFGILVAGTSTDGQFTIRNAGSADLSLASFSLEGANPEAFAVTGFSPGIVTPGSTRSFGVTFSPPLPGYQQATLRIVNSDPAKNPFVLKLSGTATAPSLLVIDGHGIMSGTSRFDPVTPGEASDLEFLLLNQGDADLVGISTVISGPHAADFRILSGPPAVIGQQDFATFTLRFLSPAAGTRSAELKIFSNNPWANPVVIALEAEAREVVVAGNGTLDPGFGSAASSVPLLPGIDPSYDLALQPDGKILVIGQQWGSEGSAPLVARFLPDGSPDMTFGGTGQVTLAWGIYDSAECLALQSDGKIVLAGQSDGQFTVARLLPDGSPDLEFADGGRTTAPFGDLSNAYDVAIAPDGKIVAAGNIYDQDHEGAAVARYLPDGLPDLSFNLTGRAVIASNATNFGRCVEVQPDGRILVGGEADGSLMIARFRNDGTLDPDFNGSGMATASDTPWSHAQEIAIQPDGKILVAGVGSIDSRASFLAFRYLPDGTLDPAFGEGGRASPDFGYGSNYCWDLALQQDGRIVLVGTVGGGQSDSDIAVARLLPNGMPDPDFGSEGKFVTDFGGWEEGHRVALESSGDIIVAGPISSPSNLGLVRYLTGLPSGGNFDVTPGPVAKAGDLLTASFSGWSTAHLPVVYQVLLDGVPLAPESAAAGLAFAAPIADGLHVVTGRIKDSQGRTTEVSRSLRVVMTAATWREFYFGSEPENTGDSDDLDHDGRVNLLEFATAGDPASGRQVPEVLSLTGESISFTYLRSKAALLDGVTFSVEWSDDPGAVSWPTTGVAESIVDQGATEQVTATLPAGPAGKRFVRLRVGRE